jgi:hypothetical protein
MYSTYSPMYLRAYIYTIYDLLLYSLLNYLRMSSNLLTYLPIYIHNYVTTYVPTYLRTFVLMYLYYLRTTNVPTYLSYL